MRTKDKKERHLIEIIDELKSLDIERFEDIFEILKLSKDIYIKNLNNNPNALSYLYKRCIKNSIIDQFQLGFSEYGTDIYDNLGNKFTEEQLKDLNLIYEDDYGNYKNCLFNRIIFPILNIENQVIGFGGRTITDKVPKYINSPESPIFRKREVLYGLNFAYNNILEEDIVVIVEGYTDVLMAHQWGLFNFVAPLGTALTEDHIRVIRRYTNNVCLFYDGDDAGKKAIIKSMKMFKHEHDISVCNLFIKNYDPCDLISKKGPEVVKKLIEKSKEVKV